MRNDVGYQGMRWILQAGDADVVHEPADQPYGVRDCAFRDPAGNLIRLQQLT